MNNTEVSEEQKASLRGDGWLDQQAVAKLKRELEEAQSVCRTHAALYEKERICRKEMQTICAGIVLENVHMFATPAAAESLARGMMAGCEYEHSEIKVSSIPVPVDLLLELRDADKKHLSRMPTYIKNIIMRMINCIEKAENNP